MSESLPDIAALRAQAMNLLARREHSRRELRDKLVRKYGLEASLSAQVEGVLDQLEADGLQSDLRFAENTLHARARRGFGPLRIAHELSGHDLDREVINTLLDDSGLDWSELARKAILKKYSSAELGDDARQLARARRFLSYRGFGGDHIRFALDDCPD